MIEQFLDCADHPHPHRLPVQIAILKALVGLHGREDRRVLPVLVEKGLGAAVNIEVATMWMGVAL